MCSEEVFSDRPSAYFVSKITQWFFIIFYIRNLHQELSDYLSFGSLSVKHRLYSAQSWNRISSAYSKMANCLLLDGWWQRKKLGVRPVLSSSRLFPTGDSFPKSKLETERSLPSRAEIQNSLCFIVTLTCSATYTVNLPSSTYQWKKTNTFLHTSYSAHETVAAKIVTFMSRILNC